MIRWLMVRFGQSPLTNLLLKLQDLINSFSFSAVSSELQSLSPLLIELPLSVQFSRSNEGEIDRVGIDAFIRGL